MYSLKTRLAGPLTYLLLLALTLRPLLRPELPYTPVYRDQYFIETEMWSR